MNTLNKLSNNVVQIESVRHINPPYEVQASHVASYEWLANLTPQSTREGVIKSYIIQNQEDPTKRYALCGLGEYGYLERNGEFLCYLNSMEFTFVEGVAEHDTQLANFKSIIGTAPAKTKGFLKDDLVVAVDFDGTITTQPDMGRNLVLQPFCKEVLKQLHEDGVRLILWTCRTGSALTEAMNFLSDNDLMGCFEEVNQQLEDIIKLYPQTARKIGADVYIDDKAVPSQRIDWSDIYSYLTGQAL